MNQRRTILLVAIFAVLNSTVWSLLVPPGHAPDEQAHVKLTTHIARHGAIPEFGKTRGFGVEVLDLSTGPQQIIYTYSSYAAQPPLPYLLAAPLVALPTDTTWMDYHQARVPQALLVGAFVVVMAALGSVMFPRIQLLPLTVAAVGGLWPQVTYLGAYLNADMLATVSSAAIVCGWFQGARREWDRPATIWMGALLGIGMLAKLNVWVLVAATAFVALVTLTGPAQRRLAAAGRTLLVTALVAGPWLAMAFTRYGTDVLAQDRQARLAKAFDATPLDAASSNWSYLHMLFGGHWISNVSKTFVIGIPGHLPGPAEWGYPLVLMVSGAIVGSVWLVTHRHAVCAVVRERALRPHVFAILLLPVLFGLASRNAFLHDIYFLGQGRYLFPALGPMLVYAVVGTIAFVPGDRLRAVVCAVVMLGAVAGNFAVLWYGVDATYGSGLRQYTASWQLSIIVLWVLAGVLTFAVIARHVWSATRSVSQDGVVSSREPVSAD